MEFVPPLPDDDIEEGGALPLPRAADLILTVNEQKAMRPGELVQLLGGFAYRNSG